MVPDGQGFYYGRFPEPKPGDDLKGANYYQNSIITAGTVPGGRPLVWEDPEHQRGEPNRR